MTTRKVFDESITPLPEQSGVTPQGFLVHAAEPEHKTEKMSVLFAFAMPDAAKRELEEKVARGETVSPTALRDRYAPPQGQVDKLVDWLKKQGFENIHTASDRGGVYADAKVELLERALAVNMVRVTRNGLTYTATRNAPSLPSEVAEGVHAIMGLQPFRQMNKHNRRRVPLRGNRAALGDDTEDAATVAATNLENAPPYLVSEIKKAYGADGLSVTGQGQTIAILIDTFPSLNDLKSFWKHNGLPPDTARVEKVNVKGTHLPAREGEETLDAEWASGIAPGAKIRIYACGSLSFVDLDRALDRILEDLPSRPDIRQLSISLGLGETFLGGPQGEVATQHQKFLKLAAVGVNVFVSSGDAGSNPDNTGHGADGPLQAEYEASDPCVVGVGGTTLKLSVAGAVTSESGWSSGGGGKSIFFSRPAWQKGPGVPQGNQRLVPDVSLAADPDTGAFLIFQGKVVQIGGTSWSAPVWAGFCALINEARQKANKPLLPFLNPLLYPLLGTACFRDITTGSNGAFDSHQGYDLVTGLGVPNVKALIQALTN